MQNAKLQCKIQNAECKITMQNSKFKMQNRRTKQEQRVLAYYALQEGGKALEEGLMQNYNAKNLIYY